ncbi:MAG: methyltransferase domain-containing protein [Chloroflexales bacterium]|nr:methyltransferase domain-containing protein [Chloroflexales bacterium]
MHIYDTFADCYEADFGDHNEDIQFYREMARRTGGPIIELMCGSGRLLLPLAEEGYQVAGVDSSARMLDFAQAKLDDANLAHRADLIHADVRSVELPERHFALAFVAINSFMHLEQSREQLAVLSLLRRSLMRKGVLILDLFNPDPARLVAEDNRLSLDHHYKMEGRQVQKFVASESDLATQTSYVTYIYDISDADGRITRRVMQFTLRWLYRYELEHLLARAGFTLRSLYGSYDLDEYNSASPRLIAVASPSRVEADALPDD